MSSNILVLGFGSLGLPVLTHLANHPSRPASTTLTVTTSRPLPSHLTQFGIKTLSLPLTPSTTTADLVDAFRSYNTVISCNGMSLAPGTQLKLAEAVLQAGVKRYIPWQFGLDYDEIGRGSAMTLFDEQLDVRDLLRGQTGTEWVIVSTGVFVGFLFQGPWNVVLREEDEAQKAKYVVRALGSWENKVTVTNEDGIGKCVAAVVLGKGSWEEVKNQAIKIAGDCVSYEQVADVIDNVTGENVKREILSVDFLKMEVHQDKNDILKRYRVVFAEGKGVAWPVEETFSYRKGLKLTNVKEWAAKNMK
ncbi:MAG: hypothetical protein Q9160_005285 [Pyrenula sp. 1 TL-2023]